MRAPHQPKCHSKKRTNEPARTIVCPALAYADRPKKLRSCKDTQSSESYSCGEVPDRTETSSGRRRSPKRLPLAVSIEAVQRRLDEHPEKMRQRRETVEHPFGTIKAQMGATHFLMKTLPRVATEMALHVLAYNLTRVMNIIGVQPLMVAKRA